MPRQQSATTAHAHVLRQLARVAKERDEAHALLRAVKKEASCFAVCTFGDDCGECHGCKLDHALNAVTLAGIK